MKTVAVCVGAVLLIWLLLSCVSMVYSREYTLKRADTELDITETLTLNINIITADTFRLEKTSENGTALYEGTFREERDRWTFILTTFSSVNASPRHFNPPVVYYYLVTKNQDGVTFDKPKIVGSQTAIPLLSRGFFAVKK